MIAPKPARRREFVTQPESLYWIIGLGGVMVCLLGLTLVTGVVIKSARFGESADWLRDHGTRVTATVTEREYGGRRDGHDSLRIAFRHDGREVKTWIECPERGDCSGWIGREVRIWADPAEPSRVVTDAANTSLGHVLARSWVLIITGLAFAAIGGATAWAIVVGWRTQRRVIRAAARDTDGDPAR